MSDLPAIQTFQFQLQDVRLVVVTDHPWFVEIDLKRVLGKGKTDKGPRLLSSERGKQTLLTPGGFQLLNIVSESGLYKYILRSSKEKAEPFQDWVTGTVLPTIRTTGRYLPDESHASLSQMTEALMQVLPAIPAMLQTMQLMVTSSQQLHAQIAEIESRIGKVEAVQTSGSGYVTLLGYGRLRKIPLSVSEARNWGIKAKGKAKELGVKLGKAPDERFGSVNTYPIELLDELFAPVGEMERILEGSSGG